MIRKILVIFILAGAAVAQTQTAPGAPGMRRDDGPRHRTMERVEDRGMGPMLPGGKFWTNTELAQKVGLTDAQVKQMDKIFLDSRLELIDRVAAVQKAEVVLGPMLQADHPDQNQVLAQIDKIAQARAELEKTNARMMLGIRQVMSAEQWQKLKAEMPKRSMRRFGPEGPKDMPGRPGPDGPPQAPPPPEQPE